MTRLKGWNQTKEKVWLELEWERSEKFLMREKRKRGLNYFLGFVSDGQTTSNEKWTSSKSKWATEILREKDKKNEKDRD